VGHLRSRPRLVGRIASGVWISASLKKNPDGVLSYARKIGGYDLGVLFEGLTSNLRPQRTYRVWDYL